MKKFLLISIIFLIFAIIYGFFIKKEDEIKIGFIGALTGKYSVLGNAMMNGAILAFEEENYKVGNKKIKLLLKDDKNNPEINKEIINGFINDNIKIVIGNVTSSMSKLSMSIINNHKDMFMISAASASNEFTKKDDQFFRVHVANNINRFDSFTKYILKKGFKNIYGVYDPDNKTYTKDYIDNFEKSFILNGGNAFVKKSSSIVDLKNLLIDIKEINPDLILVCANSVDAARFVQYIRINNINIKIASSEWAKTNTFIENSGKNGEGIIFNIDYDENSENKKFVDFVNRYEKKYNNKPSMFAAKGYELAKIIIELLKVGKENELKKNLLLIKEFDGLVNPIKFDEYGDVIREFYTFELKNGKFVKINE